MPRDIISINSTHYVGNNLYRLKLRIAVEFKKGDKLSLRLTQFKSQTIGTQK